MWNLSSPRIYLSSKVWTKLWAYTALAEAEIGGLGEITQIQNGYPLASELFLFGQTTSEVRTALDVMALAKFMTETIRTGYDRSKLRLWWHSHGWYRAIWSEKDDETIKKVLAKRNVMISIVVNKLWQYSARIDYPSGESIYWVPVLRMETGDGNIDPEILAREVAEKVKYVPNVPEEEA